MITLATQDEVSSLWRKIDAIEKYLNIHSVGKATLEGFIDVYRNNVTKAETLNSHLYDRHQTVH